MSINVLYFTKFSAERFIFELEGKMLSVGDGPTDGLTDIVNYRNRFAVYKALCRWNTSVELEHLLSVCGGLNPLVHGRFSRPITHGEGRCTPLSP